MGGESGWKEKATTQKAEGVTQAGLSVSRPWLQVAWFFLPKEELCEGYPILQN